MMESKYWRNADWDEVRNFNVKSNGWVNQIMNITTEGVWYLNYTYLRNKKKCFKNSLFLSNHSEQQLLHKPFFFNLKHMGVANIWTKWYDNFKYYWVIFKSKV